MVCADEVLRSLADDAMRPLEEDPRRAVRAVSAAAGSGSHRHTLDDARRVPSPELPPA